MGLEKAARQGMGSAGSADLVIRGGTLLNVYTGELLDGWGIAVRGERILALGLDLTHFIGPETEIVEAAGKYLTPGLIDGHTHLDNVQGLHEFLREAIPRGLTTVITELVHAANVGGGRGLPRVPGRSRRTADSGVCHRSLYFPPVF